MRPFQTTRRIPEGAYQALEDVSRAMGAPIEEAPALIGHVIGADELTARHAIEYLVAIGLIQRTEGGRLLFPALQYRHHWKKRPPINKKFKAAILERDGKSCAYCGVTGRPLEQDHVFPWSRGGEHSVLNLVLACQPCNLKKGAKTLEEFLNG
ncbi:HNH endonuclease [uncultured Planktomarina sp.]|uniref:HNH endonuclease n=1 Tax=uncultured Planktomarina sp. TaxID=1538529 RepID=UPI00326089C1